MSVFGRILVKNEFRLRTKAWDYFSFVSHFHIANIEQWAVLTSPGADLDKYRFC